MLQSQDDRFSSTKSLRGDFDGRTTGEAQVKAGKSDWAAPFLTFLRSEGVVLCVSAVCFPGDKCRDTPFWARSLTLTLCSVVQCRAGGGWAELAGLDQAATMVFALH